MQCVVNTARCEGILSEHSPLLEDQFIQLDIGIVFKEHFLLC